MIKAHYKLVTDTGKGELVYETIPDFKALDNISLIEGPNDSGKSTLLHCLAISCYGERAQYIKDKITDPGLLEKIDWLINNAGIAGGIALARLDGGIALPGQSVSGWSARSRTARCCLSGTSSACGSWCS